MEIAARIDRTKYDVFRWRYELSIPKKLALTLGMAALTGLLALAMAQGSGRNISHLYYPHGDGSCSLHSWRYY